MSDASKSRPTLYQPDKRTIGELLSTTSPPIVVPNWQRSFSWTQSHIETFWHDLLDFNIRNPSDNMGQREYFLGSVVIVTTSDSEHLLLDGQQRLATAAILLSVIRDNIKTYKADAAIRLQSKYLGDFDDARNVMVYKVSLNIYDREFFKRIILEQRDASYQEPEPQQASHKLIRGARQFFEQAFATQYATFSKPEDAFLWALRIQRVLTDHMSVVAVTSTDEDSAAEVFETLNDRGIGLSTPDLLRNLVIRRSPDPVREDIVELWGNIIQFESDTEIKTFLRQYWISNHGDIKTQRLYREIKSHIIDNKVDSLKFSRELEQAANTYRDILASRDADPQVEEYLRHIDETGGGLLYPLVLSIVQVAPPEDRADLIRSLQNLYVRHSVIGQLENSKLENVIYKAAVEIRKDYDKGALIKRLQEASPSNDAFKSAFQRVSISRTATQRYLLTRIELAKRATDELSINPGSKVHIEHIYPQTPKEGSKFQNHGQIVNKIGNLTLLDKRLNTSIKNGDFSEKKPSYATSEILMTKELADLPAWGPEAIDNRQKAFAELAPAIWPV